MKAIFKALRPTVFAFLPFIFAPLVSLATHSMGTDITYRWLSGDTYEFTLTFYRDCAGQVAPGSISLNVNSSSGCGPQGSITLNQQGAGIEVSPLCPTQASNCGSGTFPGVEQYIYTGIYTLTAPCPDWSISWNHCCRNNAITNLNQPNIRDMYVEVTVDNAGGWNNSSPTFTSLPVPYICVNQTFCYNHGAVDPDGDSLYYRLVSAQDGPFPSTNIPYNPPYTPTNPIGTVSGSVAFDSFSGSMCVTPNAIQNSVVTIAVDEFRNGILIGTTLRDLQIVVQNCSNDQPFMSSAGIVNNSGGVVVDSNTVEVCVGETLSFDIIFEDNDALDVLTVSSNLSTAIPGASISNVGTNPTVSTLTWAPNASDLGTHPFTITLQDNGCPFLGTQVYEFEVVVPLGTDAGPDRNYCPGGGPISLTATGGTNFNWSVISGDFGSLSCNPCATQSVAPSITTVYEVVSNLSAACKNRDTVTVNRIADFPLTITPATPSICRNEIANLTANAGPTGGPYSYNWFPVTDLDSTNVASPSASPAFSTKYYCEVTSSTGCMITDSVDVVVTGIGPTVSATPLDTSICLGNSIVMDASAQIAPPGCGLNPGGCSGSSQLGTIGTGTSFTGFIGPFYGSSIQVYRMRHQYIYTAAELQAAGFTQGGTITELALNLRYARALDFDDFTIKIGCTTLNDFTTSNFENGLDQVYNAATHTLPATAGWHTITFDTPYDWDGSSNIIVEFCSQGTQDNSFNYVYYTSTGPVTQTMYDYGASAAGCGELTGTRTSIRPNMAFTLCSQIITSPVYAWTPTSGLSDPTIINPVATPAATTTYQLNITDGGSGCTGSGTVSVTVGDNFNIAAIPDTTICFGAGLELFATPDVVDSYTYDWGPSSSLSNTASARPMASPTMDTQYEVAISNSACTLYDTIDVTVNGTPIAAITDLDTVCPGTTVQLDIETALSLNDDFDPGIDGTMWSNISGGLANADCGSNSGSSALHFDGTASAREATSIDLDASGCSALDFCLIFGSSSSGPCESPDAGEDVEVNYSTDGGSTWTQLALYDHNLYTNWTCFSIALPAAAQTAATRFQWNQIAFTPGSGRDNWALDDVSLSCSATGGPYLYSWTPTLGLSDPTIQNPTAVVDPSNNSYSVMVTDISNPTCPSISNLTVEIDSSVFVAVSAADPTPCSGDAVQLNANVFGLPLPVSLPSCGVNGTTSTSSPVNYTIGTGSSSSFAFSPFFGGYKDAKMQYLITAAELQAAGVLSGTITEVALFVTLKQSNVPYQNFSVGMNCTSSNVLSTSSGWEPTVPVYGPSSLATTSGWNTIPITGFDWDGTSNLVLTFCFDMPNTQSPGGYDYVAYGSYTYINCMRNFSNTNNTVGCNLTPAANFGFRPNFQFTVVPPTQNPFVYTWTPPTGLNDPAIANPTATFLNDATYMVTVTGGRCPVTDTLGLVTCSALPVDAFNLTGNQEQSWVTLNWLTLNEVNSEFFVVERSADGVAFEALGEVRAAGDAAGYRSYPFRDEHPFPGVNHYRIRLVDQDGASQNSNTLTLQFEGQGGLREVYPNPLSPSSSLHVNYWSTRESDLELTVFDLQGRQVQKNTVAITAGLNQLELAIKPLPPGVYLLNTRQGSLSQTHKLMILD